MHARCLKLPRCGESAESTLTNAPSGVAFRCSHCATFEQSVVSSVEERDHNQGRDDLDRGLKNARSEAGLLSTGLAEVGNGP